MKPYRLHGLMQSYFTRKMAGYFECLDAALERAGVLRYFAGFTRYASAVPDYRDPRRPPLNRPYPPE
jgi:hypothetical protein